MTQGKHLGPERRRYLRVSEENLLVCEPFSAEAFERQGFNKTNVFTKDVSEGGLLFESDTFFELGALLKLEVHLPGWEKFKSEFYKEGEGSQERPLVVLGKVVRIEKISVGLFDIGIAFAAIDSGHKVALKKYLERAVKSES